MAGLTATGITIETLETLLASIVADQLANISPTLNTEADAAIGQLNAIYAAALAEVWELLESIYQGTAADTASGQALSYIAALTGTLRNPATKGTVTARFHGADTTPVPAGTEFYIVGRPDSLFATIADDVIDGDLFMDIACEAVVAGSEPYGLAGEAITMPNPPTGVTTPSNLLANSVLGVDEESDADLRTRREAEIARPGSATAEAMRADLLEVAGVDAAFVFENPSGTTDANGLPPYSVECLVHSQTAPTYTAQDVVDAIWTGKPAGTETYGSLSGTATDSTGSTHTINYSTATDVRVYIEMSMSYDSNVHADDAAAKLAVQNALSAWALADLTLGEDIYAAMIIEQAMQVAGITNVLPATVEVDDITPTSTTDPLVITERQIATLDAVNDCTITIV
jgi:uncharacterized phage protein gp47/JayE